MKQSIDQVKNKYLKGTKIKLIKMEDIQAPPVGTIGIVDFVDDIGQIHCSWENGSTLALIVGVDEFEVVEEVKNVNKIKL